MKDSTLRNIYNNTIKALYYMSYVTLIASTFITKADAPHVAEFTTITKAEQNDPYPQVSQTLINKLKEGVFKIHKF